MKNFVLIAMLATIASSQARADFFDIFNPQPQPRPQQRQQQQPRQQQQQGNWWGGWDNQEPEQPYYDEEYEKANTPHPKSVDVAPFDINDLQTKPYLKSFRYIIVVNKSNVGPTKQTVTVYEDGNLIKVAKTSTGREIWEAPRTTEEEHRPGKGYWSNTPTGYFTAKWLSRDHKSSSWKTSMPWAVFFDLDNGIALHEVPPPAKGQLGQRASGGCVRLLSQVAQELFERIEKTKGSNIAQINQDGSPVLDKKTGEVVYSTKTHMYDKVYEPAYGALIIVQDSPTK